MWKSVDSSIEGHYHYRYIDLRRKEELMSKGATDQFTLKHMGLHLDSIDTGSVRKGACVSISVREDGTKIIKHCNASGYTDLQVPATYQIEIYIEGAAVASDAIVTEDQNKGNNNINIWEQDGADYRCHLKSMRNAIVVAFYVPFFHDANNGYYAISPRSYFPFNEECLNKRFVYAHEAITYSEAIVKKWLAEMLNLEHKLPNSKQLDKQ
jgi:hypothetical protein